MQVKTIVTHTIKSMLEWNLFYPMEYQRAAVWSDHQKMMFIDSVLRGYSIPAFYFHYKGTFNPAMGEPRPTYNVVDGQQRIRTLEDFVIPNGFRLLDPAHDSGFRFPNFMRDRECAWAGKKFSEFGEELQEQLLGQKVVIYEIRTDESDEIRDLFIRLQGGTPLTPQDKRDAWPGKLTEFVLSIGGKPKLNSDTPDYYPGETFFNSLVRGAPRKNTKRQLAAQMIMLYSHKMEGALCDIKSRNLDTFYHENIGFNPDGEVGKGALKVLERLVHIFPANQNLAGHEAIHLFLLTDSLMKEYAPAGWEHKLPEKYAEFRRRCKEADKAQRENSNSEYSEYWRRYSRWTRTSSDVKSTIENRHQFFVGEMLHLLNPTPLDSNPVTGLLREIVFYRDKRQCQWCRMKMEKGEINAPHIVALKDVDAHHVIPRRAGGETTLDNLVLVARGCHPKGEDNEAAFREWWENRTQTTSADEVQKKLSDLPSGTRCRFTYDDEEYEGKIEKKQLVLPDMGSFKTFSGASKRVTGAARNGWTDWEIQIPGEDKWTLADDWRKGRD